MTNQEIISDIIGGRFGKWIVLNEVKKRDKQGLSRRYCVCQCDCGNKKLVKKDTLKRGASTNCGCFRRGDTNPNITHGATHTALYHRFHGIKQRCCDSRHKSFNDYGGRGIGVCDEWLDKKNGFMNFYKWAMANGYSDNLTIDRIDNSKGYSPGNCRWITMKEQCKNRRIYKNSRRI